jgi:hypothetical protein
MPNLLPLLAFEDLEVVLIQSGNLTVQWIHNRYRHQDQVHIYLDRCRMGMKRRIFDQLIILGLRLLNTRSHMHVLRGTLRPGGGHKPACYNEHANHPGAGRTRGAMSHSIFGWARSQK